MATKRKGAAKLLPPVVITVPPIQVRVVIASTEKEGGRDGGPFGDLLVESFVDGSRHSVAEELRQLAKVIANTTGDPVEGARIFVLLKRPR
jgi:hypothetical protein